MSNLPASRDAVFAADGSVQIGFYTQCWSMVMCFSGLDVGRWEPVLFILNRQNELSTKSAFPPTFVLPVAEIALPVCHKMVWLALSTELCLGQPIITYRGATRVRVGKKNSH